MSDLTSWRARHAARWCSSCRTTTAPAVVTATRDTEFGPVHNPVETCPTCERTVHETLGGPGAVAWARAHGVEVVAA